MNKDEEVYKQEEAAEQQTDQLDQNDAAVVSVDSETEQPEEAEAPVEDKVFGMPRPIFQFTALGVALGFMVQGVLGMAGIHIDGLIPIVVCGGIGWYISKKRYEKRQAEENGTVVQIVNQDENKS